MDPMKMIEERHSVRRYLDKKIEPEAVAALNELIAQVNEESGLHIQLIEEAGGVFGGLAAKMSGWKNVPSYLALVGPDSASLEQDAGYYGQKIVLFAQSLGLNTCWAGIVKRKQVTAEVLPGEKLVIVIAIGYGETSGSPRGSKSVADVSDIEGEMPDWFVAGVEAALLAPTAINQQKFVFSLDAAGNPEVAIDGKGPFAKVDLGIVRYHFEVASGREVSYRS